MKKLIFSLTVLAFLSCSLFNFNESEGNVYVLDWLAEGIFVMDSSYTVSETPLLLSGTAPSDFYIFDDEIYVSNSGFSGTPLIQKFDIDGNELYTYETAEYSSPAGIGVDDNYVYIALFGANEILILNKNDLTIKNTITLKESPYQILVNNESIYIGTSTYSGVSEYVYIMNADDFSLDSINVGKSPCYMVKDNNNIYVSCTGNIFEDINGSIAILRNGALISKTNINSCPGKIAEMDDYIFFLNNYTEDDIFSSNLMYMNKDNIDNGTVININGLSDLFSYKNRINVLTNSEKLYLIDITKLTEVDSLTLNKSLKSASIRVYP
ncbi:hypothetical protein KAU15_02795 [candidate division WOR-3 bacterium]|nr:hypothetical protein [candidate division WOR-3 bacterium]